MAVMQRVREEAAALPNAVEDAPEVVRNLAGSIKDLIQAGLRVLAIVPTFISKVLAIVARILHRLGDRSAELAQVPTSTDRQASSRRVGVLLFLAGAGVGTAAGVAIGRATAPSEPDNVHHLDATRAG